MSFQDFQLPTNTTHGAKARPRYDWGKVEILTWGEQGSVGWKKIFSAEDIDLFIENWSGQAQSRLSWVGTGLVFLNGFKRLQRQRWAETRSEPARLELGLASPQGSCLNRENQLLTEGSYWSWCHLQVYDVDLQESFDSGIFSAKHSWDFIVKLSWPEQGYS